MRVISLCRGVVSTVLLLFVPSVMAINEQKLSQQTTPRSIMKTGEDTNQLPGGPRRRTLNIVVNTVTDMVKLRFMPDREFDIVDDGFSKGVRARWGTSTRGYILLTGLVVLYARLIYSSVYRLQRPWSSVSAASSLRFTKPSVTCRGGFNVGPCTCIIEATHMHRLDKDRHQCCIPNFTA